MKGYRRNLNSIYKLSSINETTKPTDVLQLHGKSQEKISQMATPDVKIKL
jgi:hypothetical protein